MSRIAVLVLCPLLLLAASCGEEREPASASLPRAAPPAWAKVAPAQLAAAEKHGVPVAFEHARGLRFVLVPAGTFLMGPTQDDEAQREVAIERPFYVQVTEVTNAQYRLFDPRHEHGEIKGYSLVEDDQPVSAMRWSDATAFAAWATEQDGVRTYRLPYEREWEYACRAGTTTRYYWGEEDENAWRYANLFDPGSKAAIRATSPMVPYPHDDGHIVTAPVGSYEPNAWGLYDMLGNVWEWCQEECRHDFLKEGPQHIQRGGSWDYYYVGAGCGFRDCPRAVPECPMPETGIRLVSPLP